MPDKKPKPNKFPLRHNGMLFNREEERNNAWQTPDDIAERARKVLGHINLDPASSLEANKRIGAALIFTKDNDALKAKEWPQGSVFLNPPGGYYENKRRISLPMLFWDKLMEHRASGRLTHAIFLGFNAEIVRTSQQSPVSVLSFPTCFPRRRIRFLDDSGRPGPNPSHASVITYVPGTIDIRYKFTEIFWDLGLITNGAD